MPKESLPDAIEHVISCLHLSQVLLFPMGTPRVTPSDLPARHWLSRWMLPMPNTA